MATSAELIQMEGEGDMILLAGCSAAKKASAIVNEAPPSGPPHTDEWLARLQWARDALATDWSTLGVPVWRYLLGFFEDQPADAISRDPKWGDVATPTDATLDVQVAAAIDKLYPPGI